MAGDCEDEIAPLAKNNDSLVMRLKYRERTMLLPGDAEKQVEYQILGENEQALLHADVLKVGHHGSKNSTMPEFLAAVGPKISIISAGEENPYGHPSPELLERLEESGTRIFRTDRNGAVQVLTDGENLQVSCFEACPRAAAVSAKAEPPDGEPSQQAIGQNRARPDIHDFFCTEPRRRRSHSAGCRATKSLGKNSGTAAA